MNKEENDICSI